MQDLGPCQKQAVHHDIFACELEVLGIGQEYHSSDESSVGGHVASLQAALA